MTPPVTIILKSDDNVLEFVGKSGVLYCYKYIKSETKKLTILKLTEEELNKLILNNSL